MSTLGGGDIILELHEYHGYIGRCSVHRGIHEYIGGCSVHWGFQYKSKAFINLLPYMNHDIPPMYWTSPDVLKISPRCTQDIPPMDSSYPPMD